MNHAHITFSTPKANTSKKHKKKKNRMTTGIKPHCIARVFIMEKQVVGSFQPNLFNRKGFNQEPKKNLKQKN